MATRRTHAIECLVFLLILVSSAGLSPFAARPQGLGFPFIAAIIILHDIALTALAVYLIWRNGEGLSAIGWVRKQAVREAGIGLALFLPFVICIALLESLLRAFGLPAPSGPPPFLLPITPGDYAVAALLLVVVAIAEETIFRGYLLLRFEQISGSRHFAVVLSAFLFGLGHAYQGPVGAIVVAVVGVGFALVYFWRGSLIAPMVMHLVQNAIGLLVVPRFLNP